MRALSWDVAQYETFRDERARPFFDLLARVPGDSVRRAKALRSSHAGRALVSLSIGQSY